MAMKNKTRRALVLSVLSLILCCSMLVGTTFAWFTDSATSGVNTINAGNLDIALYYAPAVDENGNPVTSVDKDDWLPVESTTSLFNENTLWEPGHVQAVYLKAVNEGSLALKYQLGVNIVGETTSTSVLGNEIKLSDYLMVDLHLADELPTYDSREAAATDEHGSWPIPGMPSYHKKLSEIEMGEASLEKDEEIFASVAIYMPTTVGNEANHAKGATAPSIKMGIMVNATQFTSEKDTYGNDYDENAEYAAIAFVGAEDLKETTVVGKGENVEIVVGGNTNENGETTDKIVVEDGPFIVNNGGNAKVDGDNVPVEAGSASNYGGITNGGATVYDNFVMDSKGGGIGAAGGGKVVFNSGKVYVATDSTSGRYNFYTEGAGSSITINGGDFGFSPEKNQKRAYIYAAADTTVTVNGGNFGPASSRSGYTAGILGEGTVIIKGGTFRFDPTAWLASGYTATEDGGVWTVTG